MPDEELDAPPDPKRRKKWTPGVAPAKPAEKERPRPKEAPAPPSRAEKWLPGVDPERAARLRRGEDAPAQDADPKPSVPVVEGEDAARELVGEERPKWKPAFRPGEELPPPVDDDAEARGEGLRRFQVAFDKAAVRKVIERHFEVYDERDAFPGLGASVLTGFYILGVQEEVDKKYPALLADLRALDEQIVPMLRMDGGETVIVVVRRPKREPKAPRLQIALFLFTVASLVLSGSLTWVAYGGSLDFVRMFEPDMLWKGTWSFALPLLFVFAVWDVARRVAARRHGMRLAFPFFIPVPPMLFFPSVGTFGTLTGERDPWPDRRAMFDVSAAGPIAGFLAALPVVILGLLLTNAVAVPVPDGHEPHLEVVSPDGTLWTDDGVFLPSGNETDNETLRGLMEVDDPDRDLGHGGNITWTYRVLLNGSHVGEWRARAVSVGATGDPLAYNMTAALDDNGTRTPLGTVAGALGPGDDASFTFMVNATVMGNGTGLVIVMAWTLPDATTVRLGEPPVFGLLNDHIVGGAPYVIHPMALAGWTALFLVGVNLLPAGRFDGGFVARALFGDRMKFLAYLAIGALFVLSFQYIGWTYLVLFVLLFVGIQHGAPLNDALRLDRKRQVWAVVLLLVFLASFVWVPVEHSWFAAFT